MCLVPGRRHLHFDLFQLGEQNGHRLHVNRRNDWVIWASGKAGGVKYYPSGARWVQ